MKQLKKWIAIWERVADWLTGIGLIFFAIGTIIVVYGVTLESLIFAGVTLYALSIVMLVGSIAADVEALKVADEVDEVTKNKEMDI